jgi:hypothetical protein
MRAQYRALAAQKRDEAARAVDLTATTAVMQATPEYARLAECERLVKLRSVSLESFLYRSLG